MEATFPALFRGDIALGGTNQVVDLLELPRTPQEQRVWGVRLHRLIVPSGVDLPRVGDRGLTLRLLSKLGAPLEVLAEDLVVVGSSGFDEEQPGDFVFEKVDLETRVCPPRLWKVSREPSAP